MENLTRSDLSYILVTVAIALLVAWFVRLLVSRPKNLPPGPTGIPFLSVAWQLFRARSDLLALFSTWADMYGEVVSFKIGPLTVVLLNSYKAIVDAFQHPDLNNRPKSLIVEEVLGVGNNGVVLSHGEVWKEQRKFAHSVFRSLGVGKKSYEGTISAEMEQLSEAIEDKNGTVFDPSVLIGQAVANIICTIVFGTQYKYTDKDFQRILQLINNNLMLAGGGGALAFFPVPGISKFPFGSPKALADSVRESNAFQVNQIENHVKNLDPDNPRDFIDMYLNKMAETKGTGSSFNNINLSASIADLFSAGLETTTTTLKWCILYMMAYPEVQSRVQAEIDRVVGRERLPRLDDQKDLPYTNAALLEVQRKGAVVPLGVPHVAAADTPFRGYTIPKGATILSNIWKVLNTEEIWKNSEAFQPERFLNEDGKLIKREELIFFSAGRRVCLGEQLARMETFLGFTSLLHRFTFKKPANSPPLPLQGILGFTYNTQPYTACAIRRD